jgi:hypothetical protein
MKSLNKTSKLFAYLSMVTCSLWIGAYLSRLFLTYRLFEARDLTLKTYINQANLSGILTTLLPSISTSFTLYIAFILFFILFISLSGISLRNNGWLFIITIIILVTLPFEIYLMTIDYTLILQLNSGTFDPATVTGLFVKRIKILGSFPLIEIFCYMSFYYFLLFRPLTKKINEN